MADPITSTVEPAVKDFGTKVKSLKTNKPASTAPSPDSYYFMGPPNAGKTVFFVTMADRLQRLHLENPQKAPYSVTYSTLETLKFVTDSIAEMTRSRWPIKTKKGNIYEINIESRKMFAMKEGKFVFHDYPGEAFMEAFVDSYKIDDHSPYKEDARTMKDEMKNAKGIFLVIDSAVLDDQQSWEIQERLFNFGEYLQNMGHSTKLAVVFTKSDIFREVKSSNPEEKFKKSYGNAYTIFQKFNTKYFYVTSAKDSIRKKGVYVPKNKYDTSQSEGIVEAAVWMMEIKDTTFFEELGHIIFTKNFWKV
jgi:hypothetical protein